jgi:hypothetical protein
VEYPDKTNDSLGRLVVFFESDVDTSTRLLFLRYVNRQLERLALAGSVKRERIYHCASSKCKGYTIPQDVVAQRRMNQEQTVVCPICLRQYPLDDLAEQSSQDDARLDGIEATARAEQERQRRLTTLDERRRSHQYHVFLCHNSQDKPAVRHVAQRLQEQGVLPWFDEQVILGGDQFPAKIEEALGTAGAVAVFIGPQGMGGWQAMEYQAALTRSIEERKQTRGARLRLIPVLLPGTPQKVELPPFLRPIHAVDLSQGGGDNREGIRKLVEAILWEAISFGGGMRPDA